MDEAPKILSSPRGGLAADLLRSAAEDEPSPRAMEQTASAIGVAGSLAVGVGSGAGGGATVAGGATVGAAVHTPATLKVGWIGLSTLKWMALGATAAALTGGGALQLASSASSSAGGRSAIAAGEAAPQGPTPAAAPDGVPVPIEAEQASPDAPVTENDRIDAPSASAPRLAADEPGTRLSDEVEALSRARSALAAGDPTRALTILDAYTATPRTHALDPEATILRIEALRASNQTTAARALARAFVDAHPGSAHATRLQAFIAETSSSAAESKNSPAP